MTRYKEIDYIASKLSKEEILCQLAEEAAELAQAALKLRRALIETNPTPYSADAATDNFLTEIADVIPVVRCFECERSEPYSDSQSALTYREFGCTVPKDGFCHEGRIKTKMDEEDEQ